MRTWEKEVLLEDLIRDNIISLDRGRVISSIDLTKYPGTYPVYSSSAQKNGLFGCYDKFDFDEELITWSVDGGGYFFYRPKHKFSVTNVSGVLKIIKPNLFDYKFLYYNLAYQHASQYYDYSDKAHPSVIKKRYFVPCITLLEQQKIASILSKLDVAIFQTEQLIEKYKQIKVGLMHDLLTRGIDENGNIRSEETHKFKDSPLGRIPVEWSIDELEKYCVKIGDGTHSSVNFTKEGEIPFLFVSCIKPFKIDYEKKSFVDDQEYDIISKGKRVSIGTVLYSLVGSYGNAVTLENNDRISFQRHVGFIETNRNEILPEFLTLFLNSNFGIRQANDLAEGNAQKTISLSALRSYILARPSLQEQVEIIKCIKTIEKTIDVFEIDYAKFLSLKSGLMHDLLTGKVRASNFEKQEENAPKANTIPLNPKAHNQHIEDAVLIAAIVNSFYSDKYPLGRKKVQKLLYLVRRYQEANIACFKKKAAGPYADEVRYKGGEPIAKANKYVVTKTSTAGTVFSKGENIEKALIYIEKWDMQSGIDWLTCQFKYTKVDQLELIATIDMARCDLEKENIPVSLSTVKHLIATNEEWKKKLEKSYFDDFSIQRGIDESYKLFGY